MKCELKSRTEIIEKYVHGKLSQKEREAFDEHCFDCKQCFHELMFYKETADLIRQEGKTVFSDYLEKSRHKEDNPIQSMLETFSRFFTLKPWRYAIAGAGLVVIVSGFVFVLSYLYLYWKGK